MFVFTIIRPGDGKPSLMKNQKKASFFDDLKFIPKPLTTLSFLGLFALVMALFWGRKSEAFRTDAILERAPDFYTHVSNFSLSYLLFAGVGYFWLMMGINFRYVLAYGGVILLLNFIYELFIPILNTPDIIDAYYGFWGILFGLVFLFLTKKFGLEEIKASVGAPSED